MPQHFRWHFQVNSLLQVTVLFSSGLALTINVLPVCKTVKELRHTTMFPKKCQVKYADTIYQNWIFITIIINCNISRRWRPPHPTHPIKGQGRNSLFASRQQPRQNLLITVLWKLKTLSAYPNTSQNGVTCFTTLEHKLENRNDEEKKLEKCSKLD